MLNGSSLTISPNFLTSSSFPSSSSLTKSILKELNEKKEELNLQISSISAEINALITKRIKKKTKL